MKQEDRMISLIFCGDLRYCPYLTRYTERLEKHLIPYRVLFWNRGNFTLNLPENYLYYDSPSSESLGKVQKLKGFIGFRRWIIKQMKENESNKVILLSTLTGILLFDKLKKYNKKYIFDIRDYSYEHIYVFRKIEKKLIKNSYFTAISSKGFKSFLPKHDYIVAHNFNRNEMIEMPKFKKHDLPLKLVWNGTVRFFDFQKQYLDLLKNDIRFQLIYHGSGTDLAKYKEYCSNNGIKNVIFTGLYDNKDKFTLLKDAAILNNCYGGRDGDQLKYAVSNRFYDGLIYHIPQLVETDGYKAEITDKYRVGISLNADKQFADKLFEYYKNIDAEEFDTACNEALEEIIQEDNLYIKKIDEFIIKQ